MITAEPDSGESQEIREWVPTRSANNDLEIDHWENDYILRLICQQMDYTADDQK